MNNNSVDRLKLPPFACVKVSNCGVLYLVIAYLTIGVVEGNLLVTTERLPFFEVASIV